jgi:recombination protein RecT
MNQKLNEHLGQQKAAISNDPVELFVNDMRQFWKEEAKRFVVLCGSQEMAARLFNCAINVVQRTPGLAECNRNTFINCLLQSAELELFPGAMQECAYVPRNMSVPDGKGGKRKEMQALFWPMYQGHIKHMYRTGQVLSISCQIVHEKDEFDFEEGSKPFVHFKRFLGSEDQRGPEVVGFAAIDLRDGGRIVELVPLDYIAKVQASALGGDSGFSPWKQWPEAMKRKTCLKRGQKWAPKSEALARIIEIDNESERPDLARRDAIDVSGAMVLAKGVAPQRAALPPGEDRLEITLPNSSERQLAEEEIRFASEENAKHGSFK